jgi:hypothetical protein
MLKGKILNTETYDFKADGTEKSAEEKAAFLFAYQSNVAIEKALVKFKADSEEFKTLTALKAKVDAMNPNDADVSKLRTDLDAMNIKFKELSEKGLPTQGKTLSAQLKEKKDALRTISKGNDSGAEIVIERKTLVQRTAIANDAQGYFLPDLGQLATRKLSLYDLFPKVPIGESNNSGLIRYRDWDQATIARAAAAVAETGTFPESTAAFTMQSIALKKIGDTLPVTEEFFEDEEMFAGELDLFLNINVQLEIDRQLSLGDGTANQMTGLVSSVNAYVLAVAPTFQFANIYDLIIDAKAQITKTGGSKYSPDFVVMNIADINKMRGTKSTFGTYVIPPFVSPDGMNVAGVTVVESNIITADTLVIGDRRFARIYEKGGIVLSKGVVNAQFSADEMTLKARKRMLFLIRYADKSGFLKVTSITAAVAALAVPAP